MSHAVVQCNIPCLLGCWLQISTRSVVVEISTRGYYCSLVKPKFLMTFLFYTFVGRYQIKGPFIISTPKTCITGFHATMIFDRLLIQISSSKTRKIPIIVVTFNFVEKSLRRKLSQCSAQLFCKIEGLSLDLQQRSLVS